MGRRGSSTRTDLRTRPRSANALAAALALAAVLTLSGCAGGAPAVEPAPSSSPAGAPASTSIATATLDAPSAGTPTAVEPPAPACAPWTQAEAFGRWVGEVPAAFPDRAPDPSTEWTDASEYSGGTTYDPCAELSWIVLAIRGGTVSSPYQIMLFHRGEYLGTGTLEAYGFFPQVTRLDDASIEVVYTWPRDGECNACATGRSTAWFAWDARAGRVVMTGDVPPES